MLWAPSAAAVYTQRAPVTRKLETNEESVEDFGRKCIGKASMLNEMHEWGHGMNGSLRSAHPRSGTGTHTGDHRAETPPCWPVCGSLVLSTIHPLNNGPSTAQPPTYYTARSERNGVKDRGVARRQRKFGGSL